MLSNDNDKRIGKLYYDIEASQEHKDSLNNYEISIDSDINLFKNSFSNIMDTNNLIGYSIKKSITNSDNFSTDIYIEGFNSSFNNFMKALQSLLENLSLNSSISLNFITYGSDGCDYLTKIIQSKENFNGDLQVVNLSDVSSYYLSNIKTDDSTERELLDLDELMIDNFPDVISNIKDIRVFIHIEGTDIKEVCNIPQGMIDWSLLANKFNKDIASVSILFKNTKLHLEDPKLIRENDSIYLTLT